MAKNIIVCSDGTGNTAVKDRGTNVFKIFEASDLNSHRYHAERTPQIAIYDDGVGTESFKPLKLLGGIGGFGLSRNVRQLYKELCRIYDPGDRIFLFGFSRGAFTIRTLAGLIASCGILKVTELTDSAIFERRVDEAYRAYRLPYRTKLMRLFLGEPDRQRLEQFKRDYCHGDEKIAFIGVWDTVDAVGLPLAIADLVNRLVYQFKFPNLILSPRVERAYHALAIDDQRQSFTPLLWEQPKQGLAPGQIMEQVWFAGAHSNVGGGYPKQGMSLVALDWIMQRAELADLRFVAAERRYYRDHTNVDDKLYNPRSGTGIFYRWMPRDIAALCARSGAKPAIHLSVLERAAHGTEDYSPGNLPWEASVVFTETGDADKDVLASERANAVQAVLHATSAQSRSLLDTVASEVQLGRNSYRVFLAACLVLVAGAIASERLSLDPTLFIAVPVLGLAVAWIMSMYSSRHLRHTFTAFWFAKQQELRDAFKRARAAASGASMPEAPAVSGPAPAPNAEADDGVRNAG